MGMRLVKDSDGSWELISQEDYESRELFGVFLIIIFVACIKGWPGVIGAIIAQTIFPRGFGGDHGPETMWIVVYFVVNIPYWLFKSVIFSFLRHLVSGGGGARRDEVPRTVADDEKIREARARSDREFRRIMGRK